MKRPLLVIACLTILGVFGTVASAQVADMAIQKDADSPIIETGGTATYTIQVSNPGEVALTGVSASDGACDDVPVLQSGDDGDGILQTTETWVYTCSVANVTAGFTNTATAVSDQTTLRQDSAAVQVADLAIAKSADSPIIETGGTASYTIQVSNPGEVALTGVSASDGACDDVPVLQSGDDGDGILQTTETWVYTCSVANVTAGFPNTATAFSDQTALRQDSAAVQVADLAIAKSADNPIVETGGTATYTIQVSNPGEVALTGVSASDGACDDVPVLQSGDDGDGILQTTETWVYTCSVANVTAGFPNTATAFSDQTALRQDSAAVQVADLAIAKSTDNPIVETGGTATYTIQVSNPGEVALTGVSASDGACDDVPVLQSGDDGDAILQTTETWVYTCSVANVTAGFPNTATAFSDQTALRQDSAAVQVADLAIAKTPDLQDLVRGQAAVFTITLTNPGEVALTGVTVTDNTCDAPGPALQSGDDGDGILQTTETWLYSCAVANVQNSFTNTATADSDQTGTRSDTANVNLVPAAVDDLATVNEDSSANPIDVLANDDTGDPVASVTAVTQPTNGSASPNGTNVLYTPAADYCNTNTATTDDFSYTVTDANGDTDTAVVQVTVNCAPDAADDAATVDEDSSANAIDVLADDDLEDAPSTITAVSDPVNGSAAINGTATGVEYTPDPDFCNTNTGTTDDFTYTVTDADGDTDTATVAVTVTCINDVPAFTKGADQTVTEDVPTQSVAGWATGISAGPANEQLDQSVTFNVTGNTNPALFATGPAVAPDGELTYTPATDAFGTADITITLSDDCGSGTPPASCGTTGVDTSASQTFTITVDNINDPPSFISGGNVITETGSGEQTLPWATGIDVGPANENQTPSFTVTSDCNPSLIVTGPSVDPDGTLRFTPVDFAAGICNVSATLSDGVDSFGPVLFTIELVTASKPIADPQTVETDGGNDLTIVLTGSDPDHQLPLAFQVIEPETDADTGAILSNSGPFRGTLDDFTPATNTDNVSANVVYSPDGPFFSDTVLLATSSIFLSNDTHVDTGDLVVNDAGGTLFIARRSFTSVDYAVKADQFDAATPNEVGGTVSCNSGDFGTCAPGQLDLPVFDEPDDPLPPFLIGDVDLSNNVTVAKNATVPLDPGIYGHVQIAKNGTLLLTGGKYSFASIDANDRDTSIQFGGPTVVMISGRLIVGANGVVGSTASAGDNVFYLAGSDVPPLDPDTGAAVWLRSRAQFHANIYAPNGTIFFSNSNIGTGAFLAQDIWSGNSGIFNVDSYFGEAPDQFDFEVTDQQGLVSERATVLINQDDVCRDSGGQIVTIAAFDGEAATDGATSIDITLKGCESTDVPVTVTATNGTQGTVSGLPTVPAGPPYEFVVTYTPTDPVPNNRDSFTFTLDNGFSQATATVEINEPPCEFVEAIAEHSLATDEDNPLTITLSGCDPDDGVLAFSTDDAGLSNCTSCAISPLSGPIVDNRPGHTSFNVVFTHSEIVAVTTSFDYTVTGASGADSKTLTVEVNPVPVAPVANDDDFSVTLGGTFSGNVLANDTDVNGDTLTATLVGGAPAQASIFTLNPDGSFVYTHNGAGGGVDSFQYAASDGGLSDTATASITVVAATIQVTVNKTGAGAAASSVTSNPAGIDCGSVCGPVTYMTTEPIRLNAVAGAGFVFTGWSGDADCIDGELTPVADRTCSANFDVDTSTPPTGQDILVTVVKDGTGFGTVTSTPAGIDCGAVCMATIAGQPRITLSATADAGSVFAGFSGGPGGDDCEDSELEAVFDTTCSATFQLTQQTLTIRFAGTSTGAVDSEPGGISCTGEPCTANFANGTTVTLSGRPDVGLPSTVSWDNVVCVEDGTFSNKATVLMTGNLECTVFFD